MLFVSVFTLAQIIKLNIMKIKILIIILISIFIISCKNNIIAKIGESEISTTKIDSIISTQVFELKQKAIDLEISKLLLENEAKKNNISLEQLVKKEITSKSRIITLEDIKNYIINQNLDTTKIDTTIIINYLKLYFEKERQIHFVDSLKYSYDLNINLLPDNIKSIDLTNVSYHSFNNLNNNTIVYIISDYLCPTCQKSEKILKKLITKYNNKVDFRFVYYSSYIDKPAIACEAASKQNKFWQMHDSIFDNTNKINMPNYYIELANSIGLDTNIYKQNLEDEQILKDLLNNKKLLFEKGIYSTPVFIVNNKVLDFDNSIFYLDNLINNQINE